MSIRGGTGLVVAATGTTTRPGRATGTTTTKLSSPASSSASSSSFSTPPPPPSPDTTGPDPAFAAVMNSLGCRAWFVPCSFVREYQVRCAPLASVPTGSAAGETTGHDDGTVKAYIDALNSGFAQVQSNRVSPSRSSSCPSPSLAAKHMRECVKQYDSYGRRRWSGGADTADRAGTPSSGSPTAASTGTSSTATPKERAAIAKERAAMYSALFDAVRSLMAIPTATSVLIRAARTGSAEQNVRIRTLFELEILRLVVRSRGRCLSFLSGSSSSASGSPPLPPPPHAPPSPPHSTSPSFTSVPWPSPASTTTTVLGSFRYYLARLTGQDGGLVPTGHPDWPSLIQHILSDLVAHGPPVRPKSAAVVVTTTIPVQMQDIYRAVMCVHQTLLIAHAFPGNSLIEAGRLNVSADGPDRTAFEAVVDFLARVSEDFRLGRDVGEWDWGERAGGAGTGGGARAEGRSVLF